MHESYDHVHKRTRFLTPLLRVLRASVVNTLYLFPNVILSPELVP